MRLTLSAGALLSLCLGFVPLPNKSQRVVDGRAVPAHQTVSSSKAVVPSAPEGEEVVRRGKLRRLQKRGPFIHSRRGRKEAGESRWLWTSEDLASSAVDVLQLAMENGGKQARWEETEHRRRASLDAVKSVHDDFTLPEVPPLTVPSAMPRSQRWDFQSRKMQHMALSTYDVVVPSVNGRDCEFAMLGPDDTPHVVGEGESESENDEEGQDESESEAFTSSDNSIIQMARRLLLLDPERAIEYYDLEKEGLRIDSFSGTEDRDKRDSHTEQAVFRIPYMTLTMTATPHVLTRNSGIVALHNFTSSASQESEGDDGEQSDGSVGQREEVGPIGIVALGDAKDRPEVDGEVDDGQPDSKGEELGDAETKASANVVDYANKNSGAVVLEKSPAFQGASNLILSDVDRYALVPCDEEHKFIVVGLSEDIMVKEVRLSSFERYSSHVRKFQVLGSQSFPVLPGQNWVDLGTFEAAAPSATGSREQTFELKEPSWARYLKFRLLSHYGVEDYCTLTQIKVHGWTMLQGFHKQLMESKSEAEKEVLTLSAAESDSTGSLAQPGKTDAEAQIPTKGPQASQTVFHGYSCGRSGVCHDGPLRAQVHTASDVLDNLRSSSGSSSSAASGETACGSEKASFKAPMSEILSSASFRPLAAEKSSRPASRDDVDHSVGVSKDHSVFSASNPANSEGDAGSYSHAVRTAMFDASEAIRTMTESSSVGHAVRELHKMIMDRVNASFVLPSLTSNMSVEESRSVSEGTYANDEMSLHTSGMEDFFPPDDLEGEQVNPASVLSGISNDSLDDSRDDVIMSVEVLKFIKRKLPNSSCLESLSIQDFRSKLRRGRSPAPGGPGSSSTSSGSGGQSSGMMEPIFKTLTDELKLMQIQQSLYDQYLKSLTNCYSRVVVDMATEMEAMEESNEARLSAMEEAIRQLQTNQKASIGLPQGLVEMASLAGRLWNSFSNLIVWHLREVLVDSPHFLALLVGFSVLRWLVKLVRAVSSWFGKRKEEKAPSAHRRRRRVRKQVGSAPTVNGCEASVEDDEDEEEKTLTFSNQERNESRIAGKTNGAALSAEYSGEEHENPKYTFPPGRTLEDDLSYSDDSGDKPPLSRVIVPGGLLRR